MANPPVQHIHPTATVPLCEASPQLLQALRNEGVILSRVTDQKREGDRLHVFYTRPRDATTYLATIHLNTLEDQA